MKYKLILLNDHLCVELNGKHWILDTGSPISFGDSDVNLGGVRTSLPQTGLGGFFGATLSADSLSDGIGIPVEGLLGNDVFGSFTLIFDLPNSTLEVLSNDLDVFGHGAVPFGTVMGVPVFECGLNGKDGKMFFDTGAMISYWQDDLLSQGASMGTFEDFYPGLGDFTVDTYAVDAVVGSLRMSIQTGALPGALGVAIQLAANGILGNEVLREHRLVYNFSKKLYEWI